MITTQQLREIAPYAPKTAIETYPALLSELMVVYQINTRGRITAFLAQLAHESGSFRYVEEIADGSAYEGRADLGNVVRGDGKKFKGRGLIQITGRGNYLRCSLALFGDDRLLKNPELLEQPRYAVQSACWFWKDKGLNELADLPDTWTKAVKKLDGKGKPYLKKYTKFQWITKIINGGQNGISERELFYSRARKLFD